MIENAWVPASEVEPGTEVPVKVFVRPYRGERIERDFTLKIPAGLQKGEHRVLFSDAETLNRHAKRRRYVGTIHRHQANRFADESGTQQQQALCFAG